MFNVSSTVVSRFLYDSLAARFYNQQQTSDRNRSAIESKDFKRLVYELFCNSSSAILEHVSLPGASFCSVWKHQDIDYIQ